MSRWNTEALCGSLGRLPHETPKISRRPRWINRLDVQYQQHNKSLSYLYTQSPPKRGRGEGGRERDWIMNGILVFYITPVLWCWLLTVGLRLLKLGVKVWEGEGQRGRVSDRVRDRERGRGTEREGAGQRGRGRKREHEEEREVCRGYFCYALAVWKCCIFHANKDLI